MVVIYSFVCIFFVVVGGLSLEGLEVCLVCMLRHIPLDLSGF